MGKRAHLWLVPPVTRTDRLPALIDAAHHCLDEGDLEGARAKHALELVREDDPPAIHRAAAAVKRLLKSA